MNKSKKSYASIRPLFQLFNQRDRKKIYYLALIQIMLGILDLIGVLMVGLFATFAINLNSNRTSNLNSVFLDQFMNNYSSESKLITVGAIASVLLTLRTVISALLIRKSLIFIGNRSAKISHKLLTILFSQSRHVIQQRSTFENMYSVTAGVTNVILGVIGGIISAIADIAIISMLLIGLFIADYRTAIISILYFSIVFLILNFYTNRNVLKLGTEEANLSILSNQKINEILNSYREISIKSRQHHFIDEVGKVRFSLADVLAQLSFIPQVSKFILESSIVVGSLLLAIFLFIFQDTDKAITTITIFLVASIRIAPAILRLQQNTFLIRKNISASNSTLDLLEKQKIEEEVVERPIRKLDWKHKGFTSNISMQEVEYSYPNLQKMVINKISLNIKQGETIAIVGRSGSGKSTLLDLILGLLIPSSGFIKVSKHLPSESIEKWPGAIGYVPQKVSLLSGSIKENIMMGYNEKEISNDKFWKVLEATSLVEFVNQLPDKEQTIIGENGFKVSGGQLQRIGLARCLISNPKLVVLDEATSALDGSTELKIMSALKNDMRSRTLIVVTHRLFTIRNADRIYFIKNGKIADFGTFNKLIRKNKDFKREVRLSSK